MKQYNKMFQSSKPFDTKSDLPSKSGVKTLSRFIARPELSTQMSTEQLDDTKSKERKSLIYRPDGGRQTPTTVLQSYDLQSKPITSLGKPLTEIL